MADIRIKDLTTLESASLTGDVFVIDGTTGTRKLSAFSPSFGGNATVTGTLTANGTITANSSTNAIVVNGAGITMDTDPAGSSASLRFVDGATPRFWIYKLSGDSNLYIRDMTNSRMQARFNPNSTSSTAITSFYSKVEIDATTASTTTSTGALVVGNGTSGGLGVGGSVNINNNLTLGYASVGDSVLKIIRSQGGNEWLQIAGWSAGSLGNNAYSIDAVNGGGARPVYFRRSTDAGSTYTNFLTWDTSNNATFAGTLTVNGTGTNSIPNLSVTGIGGLNVSANFLTSANTLKFSDSASGGLTWSMSPQLGDGVATNFAFYSNDGVTSTPLFRVSSAGVFRLPSTASSTSTSSGALVVSGGVGVAGKVTSTALGLANTSQSATAWGDVGVQLSVAGAVLTDTSSSGTVGRIVTNSIAASALAASSTTTYTAAASLFIAGAPTANTNVTITNAYALYTAGGRINFQGLPTSSAGLQAGTLWNDGGTLKVA